MSNDLRDLYQEVVIDHSRHPRNFLKIENPTCTAEGFNPLCGDHLTLYVKLAEGVIEDIAFQGDGCAISKASASLMTTELKGKKQEEALALFTPC
jgi:nitrogen fixation NifU-like protein